MGLKWPEPTPPPRPPDVATQLDTIRQDIEIQIQRAESVATGRERVGLRTARGIVARVFDEARRGRRR